MLKGESPSESLCTFTGCVGEDEDAEKMAASCESEGVTAAYQVCKSGLPTGTCAVLINGSSRSLVANLAAASEFQDADLSDETLAAFDLFYFEGFFTGASQETIRRVAEYSRANGKKFLINLSAPFVPAAYKQVFIDIYDSIDFLFGNECEMAAFADGLELPHADLSELALTLANPVIHANHRTAPLTVVITQGAEDTIVAKTGDTFARLFPIEAIEPASIVDTNGAGDAYVGGFLAGLIMNRSQDECARIAAVAAKHVIQRIGASYGRASEEEIAALALDDQTVGEDDTTADDDHYEEEAKNDTVEVPDEIEEDDNAERDDESEVVAKLEELEILSEDELVEMVLQIPKTLRSGTLNTSTIWVPVAVVLVSVAIGLALARQ